MGYDENMGESSGCDVVYWLPEDGVNMGPVPLAVSHDKVV